MAKTKTFADKMLKGTKPREESEVYKVVNARLTPRGTVRYETRMVKVVKGEDEKKAFGI